MRLICIYFYLYRYFLCAQVWHSYFHFPLVALHPSRLGLLAFLCSHRVLSLYHASPSASTMLPSAVVKGPLSSFKVQSVTHVHVGKPKQVMWLLCLSPLFFLRGSPNSPASYSCGGESMKMHFRVMSLTEKTRLIPFLLRTLDTRLPVEVLHTLCACGCHHLSGWTQESIALVFCQWCLV